jgi:hypothetical protein
MNIFIAILLCFAFFIIGIIGSSFFKDKSSAGCVYDNNPMEYMNIVNNFIRRESLFEIHKWILEERFQKSGVTGELTIVQDIRNNEVVKKKVAIITTVIAYKMSLDICKSFNKVYQKDMIKINKKESVNNTLHEYIARYVYFIIRRMTHDITAMVNSFEHKDKKLEDVINLYILGLEETIYQENNIFLINNESLFKEEIKEQ